MPKGFVSFPFQVGLNQCHQLWFVITFTNGMFIQVAKPSKNLQLHAGIQDHKVTEALGFMMSGLTMLTLCYERTIVYKCMVMFSILASHNVTFMQVSLGRVAPPSTTVKTCIRVSFTVLHIYIYMYIIHIWVLVKIGVHDWMVFTLLTL